MKNNNFVHLHVHSEYSLLDGLSKIKKLLSFVSELKMKSLAITDHGALYGAVEFYKNAKDFGIKPIIGMEGYITNDIYNTSTDKIRTKNYHIILLSKNETGYKNLMKISSIAHLDGYYYRPRFDYRILKKYANGLICTSACPQGEIPQLLIDDDYDNAVKKSQFYLDIFGDDFYFELQRHGYKNYVKDIKEEKIRDEIIKLDENENIVNNGLLKLSRSLGVPIIATNDSHYLHIEDATAQDALTCIATGKNVSDIQRLRFIDTPAYHLCSPSEMENKFSDLPEAIENTCKISDKCELNISSFGKWFFPKFNIPGNQTEGNYLKKLVYERLPKKIKIVDKSVKKRLEEELSIINRKGYASYFLIVMDMVNWASNAGIVTNTRGSAAGSLVSYILGITTVNPLKYYLPFERFLNPYRPSPPDIDFDVADSRREEVIRYICDKYGKDKVAQICTFGRMLSRASVRDVARVLGYPYATGDKIAKLIPPPKQGFPITIPKAIDEVEKLKQIYDSDPDVKKILDLSMQIEGNARHMSVHAAGVVISPTVLTDFVPLQREPSGEKIITQYEFHACEDIGLIKFDILGIRNLTILGESIRLVKDIKGINIDLHKIPLNDEKTFKMLGKGDTMGTFQLSSSGMTKYLKELKPTKIEDLMAMVALYRPGPIDVIPEYIRRKKNPKLVKYLDPRMKRFLEASYGLLVYQDDLLFCAIDLAGYSWEEADKFRKAVGKKIPEEMAAQKEKFIKGIINNGQSEKFAEDLWKLFEPFQAYGFNKAHAASYGVVAYWTSYMKANYPVEYMCALMTAESNDKDKVSSAVNECKRMGINVLPPDLNESSEMFKIVVDKNSLDKKAIRFGLSAIKNVGIAATNAIIEARKSGDFISVLDFLTKVDGRKVNKKVLESLIKVGAFSKYSSRKFLLNNIDELREKAAKSRLNNSQEGLFNQDEIKKVSSNYSGTEDISEFADDQIETLERELLGLSLTGKPIAEILSDLVTGASHKIDEIHEDLEKHSVIIACLIKDIRVIITKKTGQEMAFIKVEDQSGVIDLVVFPKIYQLYRKLLITNKPLLISGIVDVRDENTTIIVSNFEESVKNNDDGEVFINIPKNTTKEVFLKLKELLNKNQGRKNAYLVFEKTNKKLKLPFLINWNKKIAKEISDIFKS